MQTTSGKKIQTKIKTGLCTCLIFVSTAANAQTLLWARSFGGSSLDEGRSITLDAKGNVYTTGYFSGSVDFDPGAGITTLSATSAEDVYIQKMDPSGLFCWAKSFGGSTQEFGNSICVDDSGNVYTTGFFQATVDFDPGPGTFYLSAHANRDIFVHKMDTYGNFRWAKSFGDIGDDRGQCINVDSLGNVYITGIFRYSLDLDPGPDTALVTTNGNNDFFVLKLDSLGNYVWGKAFGGGSSDQAYSSIIDASGNIYTTGSFHGMVDFDPGLGTTTLSSVFGYDTYVLKMDASGNFLWVRAFGGNGYSDIRSTLSLDGDGNVYTAGTFDSTEDFDPGPGTFSMTAVGNKDVFVQKMDASGNFIWAKGFGGTSYGFGNFVKADASGNLYTTGYYQATVDFDPGPGVANLSSAGLYDIFLQKLDSAGNFVWAKSFGGSSNDIGYAIDLDPTGNIHTTGFFETTVNFDPVGGITNLSSLGLSETFVQKLSPVILGMGEFENGMQVSVYPNPSTGNVIVSSDLCTDKVELRLTDSHGKEILKKEFDDLSNTNIELPVTKGVYYLSISTPKAQSVIKLVRE